MREIKFKVWDKKNKKMIYPKGILFDGRIVDFSCGMLEPFEGYEIMQYTGLRDSKRTKEYPNGQEIYEGDIVETVTASGSPFGNIDVVRYQDGGFKLVDDTDSLLPIYIGDKEVISIEVIGNIYEDKHLLDGGK